MDRHIHVDGPRMATNRASQKKDPPSVYLRGILLHSLILDDYLKQPHFEE